MWSWWLPVHMYQLPSVRRRIQVSTRKNIVASSEMLLLRVGKKPWSTSLMDDKQESL